jgi:hypothetical protein
MGIIFTYAAALAKARREGTRFDTTLTLGHLWSYLTDKQFEQLARACGVDGGGSISTDDPYADGFIRTVLGASSVQSLDYSDFEGCDIVHDLNQPVPPAMHEQFDVIIDGGSLEHVFNFPTAIANCMRMVKQNGSIFILTAANNCLGHGFYQFSPELFFRVFDEKNGFEVRNVVLEEHRFPGAELSQSTRMYAVTDPAIVQERVGLVSSSPVLVMIHAVRKEITDIFREYPIQSDYASRYTTGERDEVAAAETLVQRVIRWMPITKRRAPLALRLYVRGMYQLRHFSFSNRRFYKKWSPF